MGVQACSFWPATESPSIGSHCVSKKYIGKTCVYCSSAIATCGEHIFARKFFLPADRKGLPKVPGCDACNARKSELELYALAVLPFGGRHAGARENLATMVPGRLEKNAPLGRTISQGFGKRWVDGASGLRLPVTGIPMDAEPVMALFKMIGRGLLWHHWQRLLAVDTAIDAGALDVRGESLFRAVFEAHADARVSETLGDGTVRYDGFFVSRQDGWRVGWRIEMYGGVAMADARRPGAISDCIWVVVGHGGFPQVARALAERSPRC